VLASTVAAVALFAVLLESGYAQAEAFKETTPGVSTKGDVIDRFGKPDKVITGASYETLGYGSKRIDGYRQVFFRIAVETQRVARIEAFPSRVVDPKGLAGTYGKRCTSQTDPARCYVVFRSRRGTQWRFRVLGLVLYLNHDASVVRSLVFTAATSRGSEHPSGEPSASPEAKGDVEAGAETPTEAPAESSGTGAANAETASEPSAGEPGSSPESPAPLSGPSILQLIGLTTQVRFGAWSASRSLDTKGPLLTGMLWLKLAPDLGQHFGVVLDGWLMGIAADRLHTYDWRLRDAYVRLTLGPVELRVGHQLIVWGRADGINPTDNLSPTGYTLLVSEDGAQRSGTPSAQLTVSLRSFSITGVWLPYFLPSVVPLAPVTEPLVYRKAPSGFDVQQAAFKLQQEGGGPVDWSVSYFHGRDPLPDLKLDLSDPTMVVLALEHNRVDVIGADAAATLGSWNLRAEAAYTQTHYSPNGTDPLELIKRPFIAAVLGFDRNLTESLNINVQYLFRAIMQHTAPPWLAVPELAEISTAFAAQVNQMDPYQHGAMLRLGFRSPEGTFEAEALALAWVAHGLNRPVQDTFNYMLRGRFSYAISDEWKVLVGADWFDGPATSFFGRLHNNSLVFGELRWAF
jgi:hypothetical protein